MITATLIGGEKLIARFQQMHPKILGAVRLSIEALAIELTAKVKADKLSGQVLRNRTGTLRRSINYRVNAAGNSVIGSVGTNLEYAAIHEYGGQTKPHEILPKNAKALKFQLGGKTIFAKSVKHPGSKMPVRSFLRSALQDMEQKIRAKIEADVKAAL